MLSPNPMNFVTVSRGGAVTVTCRVQDAVRLWASVAVHVTVVVPTGNVDPLAGTQRVVSGASPSAAGMSYDTGNGVPAGEETVTESRHAICGPLIPGAVGLSQAARTLAMSAATAPA